MSHFYGTLKGNRGEATRCGSKESGVTVHAAGWTGGIRVHVYQDHASGEDRFVVQQIRWHGGGISEEIASGVLGKSVWPKGMDLEAVAFAALARKQEGGS